MVLTMGALGSRRCGSWWLGCVAAGLVGACTYDYSQFDVVEEQGAPAAEAGPSSVSRDGGVEPESASPDGPEPN